MARPLSEEKREAILSSATELVARLGTGAPTARIAKEAGVSEGTLFTYFANKDDLLNQLYLEIEEELATAMLGGYPAGANPRERTRHVWNRFIDWGAASPAKRKAIRQLKASDRIRGESKRCSDGYFLDIRTLLEENLAGHVADGYTPDYVGAVLDALADATLEFIARDPASHDRYRQAGFDVFWKGIAR